MKKATEQILEIEKGNLTYHLSVLEKENDSGLLFNQRVFFLLADHHFGYISEVKMDQPPERINFEKPKLTVLISDLKSVSVSDKIITLKFIVSENNKKIDKVWVIRAETSILARKWSDKLQLQKANQLAKNTPKQLNKGEKNSFLSPGKTLKSKPPELDLTKQYGVFYSKSQEKRQESQKKENPKQYKQIGTSPKSNNSNFLQRNKEIEPKKFQEIGTAFSPMNSESNKFKFQLSPRNMSDKTKNNQISKNVNPNQNQDYSKQFDEQKKFEVDSLRSEPVKKYQNSNQSKQMIILDKSRISSKPGQQQLHKNKNPAMKIEDSSLQDNQNGQQQQIIQKSPSSKKQKSLEKQSIKASQRLSLKQSEKSYIPSNKSEKRDSKFNNQLSKQSLSKSNMSLEASNHRQTPKSSKFSSQVKPIQHQKSIKKQNVEVQGEKKLVSSNSLTNRIYITKQQLQRQSQAAQKQKKHYYEMTRDIVKDTKLSQSSYPNKSSVRELGEQKQIHLDRNNYLQPDKNSIKSNYVRNQQTVSLSSNPSKSSQMKSLSQMKNQSIIQEEEQEDRTSNNHPWTYRFFTKGEAIYKSFIDFGQQLSWDILSQLYLPDNKKKYVPKLVKDNIYYYEIEDLEIKLSLMDLEDICLDDSKPNSTERICKKTAVKTLENQFNNYEFIYKYLPQNGKIHVPLVALLYFHGFVILIKTLSKQMTQNKFTLIKNELDNLKLLTKVDHNFNDHANKIIIHLNQNYYDSFKNRKEQDANFNLYLLQQISEFLPQDMVSDDQRTQILRAELIQKYGNQIQYLKDQYKDKKKLTNKLKHQNKQIQAFSKNIIKSISEIIPQFDSLDIYFLHPKEISTFLHKQGINMRYLGAIYENLKGNFPKTYLMTEMAARTSKALFRKTVQDIIFEEGTADNNQFLLKICDFLNCLLGNTYETAAIWKVLSIHNRSYFGIQLNFDEIHKGHFVISLVQHCQIEILWDKIKPDEIFKSNHFFNQKNLISLKISNRTYYPYHNPIFSRIQEILASPECIQNFEELKSILKTEFLEKSDDSLIFCLTKFEDRLRRYLSYFISPQNTQELIGVNIYRGENECPSKVWVDLQLMEIKWWLKLRKRQRYIKSCDDFIRTATKYFGQFHLVFSQLYDLFSAYHLANCQYEDAVTFAKSSLVNILKICGSNHQKTSECYYHLALCYIKANRRDQAITHIKKAKMIFESNNLTTTVPYALMSLKLALLYLNQNQTQQCLKATQDSLNILALQHPNFQDEVTQCYQMLARCYELLQKPQQMSRISILSYQKLLTLKSPLNFQKMLKIYLYPILSTLSSQTASSYLDIISLLPTQANAQNYNTAYQLLKQRIQEENFGRLVQYYFEKLLSIEKYISENNILGSWQSLAEVYDRETVDDFISLSQELIAFLGEGYLAGSLREAL